MGSIYNDGENEPLVDKYELEIDKILNKIDFLENVLFSSSTGRDLDTIFNENGPNTSSTAKEVTISTKREDLKEELCRMK